MRRLRVPASIGISPPVRLDDLVQQQVRELWWRQRRHEGVDLPPEPGVIVFNGGRR